MMLSKITFIALLLISVFAMHTFATPAPVLERIDERGKYIKLFFTFQKYKLYNSFKYC